ncbi:TetR family transcriptional regulator [Kitasatospora sp. NBC_00315]|uniref:TetR family transcriptional regulator n=1 Tax=Kitasatospora sp. NBC_00315 TaxID=2975963 RepID=UPI0032511CA1
MQERAARTREGLVCSAAGEFDRHGYAGSSLAGITRSAGISMGALTFHFATKEELAAAVREEGHAATLAVVGQVAARREGPVQSVVSLTLALAELLETEAAVRAAARLTREQQGGGPDWTSAWAPVVRDRLLHPRRGGAQRSADWTTVAALASHLVVGVEADVRERAGRDDELDGRSVEQLSRIWDLVLRGVAAAPGADG